MSDPIAALKRELLDAAARLPTGAAQARRREPGWSRGSAGRRGSRRAAAALVLTTLFLIAGAAAIAAVSGVWRSSDGTLTTNQPPSSDLKTLLGVLRRPQTAADRSPFIVRLAGQGPPGQRATIELSGVRLATTLANGVEVFLAPEILTPLGRTQWRLRGDVVGVFVAERGRPSGGGCCLDAAHIKAGGPGGLYGEAPRGATTIAVIVPDGVVGVSMYFARQKTARPPGYSPSFTLTIPVHGNVAAVTSTARPDLTPKQTTWYGAENRVVKVFVNRYLP